MSRRLSATPFRATFDGEEIFDAFQNYEPGWAEYASLRSWEMELMLELRMVEQQYSELDVKQRARMVAGLKLSEWLKALDSQKAAKEAKKHGR